MFSAIKIIEINLLPYPRNPLSLSHDSRLQNVLLSSNVVLPSFNADNSDLLTIKIHCSCCIIDTNFKTLHIDTNVHCNIIYYIRYLQMIILMNAYLWHVVHSKCKLQTQ